MSAPIIIPVEDIEVGERLRKLRESTVIELMESIRKVGLPHPVSVMCGEDKKFHLIAGAHRLEAIRRLKIKVRIEVHSYDNKEADLVALAEIDENLCRAELSPASRRCTLQGARSFTRSCIRRRNTAAIVNHRAKNQVAKLAT